MKKRLEILQGSATLKAVLFVKYNAAKDPTKEKLLCQTQSKEAVYALCFTGPCIDFRRFFHCGLTALIAIDLWSFPSRERTKKEQAIPTAQWQITLREGNSPGHTLNHNNGLTSGLETEMLQQHSCKLH